MPAPTTHRSPFGLETLVPFVGGSGDVPLRTLRMALVLTALLTPVFWVVYRVTNPGAYDPLWARALTSVMALGAVVASYAVPLVRDHPERVYAVAMCTLLAWFALLAARNDFAADYAFGYCFVLTTTALMATLVWDRPGPLFGVMGLGFVAGVVAALSADPSPGAASPAVVVVAMMSGVSVFFLMFYGRLRGVEALEASQARLAEAERLAQTGAWSSHLGTGRRVWSQGVYSVLGVERSDGPPPSVYDSVHPDDLETCRAEMARLAAGSDERQLLFRIVRPDGETRWVEGTAGVAEDAQGRQIQGVIQDVTESVAREAELRVARDQAETANRAKGEFLANMSHEIRTPLTTILGYAQMLRDEVSGEHVELVTPIEVGGRRLLGTLNSVLDLARLEGGAAELKLEELDPAAEAAEAVLLFQSEAVRKGIGLDLALPPAPLAVRADADALGRVLANLLSNAVKFTDAGRVSVAVREHAGRAELAVTDTGRGMDRAFLSSLYTPFQQASTGWSRSHEGTGLGLTITRRLVAAMGGELRVESEPGVGTTFTVSLPLAAPSVSVPGRAHV